MDKRPPLNHHQRELALQLFDLGAVKIAAQGEPGWPLRRHQDFPDDPLSPIYFDLRTKDNPKPGPLTNGVLRAIGWQLQCISRDLEYDLAVPVPNAGDPLAQAFVAATPFRMKLERKPIVRMVKHERMIVGLRQAEVPLRRALPIDDVITGADSMLEAIVKLQRSGLIVQSCLALVDREQGGTKLLHEAGVEPKTVYVASELLELYLTEKRIDQPTADRVQQYLTSQQYN